MLGKRLRCLTNGGLLGGQRGVAEARKCQEQHRARKKQAGAAKEGYIVALSYVVEYCEGPGPGDRTYQNERVSARIFTSLALPLEFQPILANQLYRLGG